jgi:hypothetical protein
MEWIEFERYKQSTLLCDNKQTGDLICHVRHGLGTG